MFGGLELKGSSAPSNDRKDEGKNINATTTESAASTTSSSGFSFMTTSAATAEPEPTPAVQASSGFSFMSSIGDTSTKPTNLEMEVDDSPSGPSGFSFMTKIGDNNSQVVEEESSPKLQAENPIAIPSTSGFSFLSNKIHMEPSSDNVADDIHKTKTTSDESVDNNNLESNNPVSSSFSFLSSAIGTGASTENASEKPKQSNDTIFSMLSSNLGPATKSGGNHSNTSERGNSSNPSGVSNTNPPMQLATATASTADILLQINPSQPTGSGIVFGGAAKPKTVKKRARGKKIGVGSGTTASSTPVVLPEPSTHTQTTSFHQSTESDSHHYPSDQQEGGSDYETAHSGNRLSKEADAATMRAQEFIASKLTSNKPPLPSSYLGRYSGENTVVEDYGDSIHSTSNFNTHIMTSNANSAQKDQSDEYKKAAAAAKEAKQLEASRKIGFMGSGGFSSLFKRNFSGTASTGSSRSKAEFNDTGNDSTTEEERQNYIEQKEYEWKVPTYGEPSDNSDENTGNYDDSTYNEDLTEESKERREEEIRIELEREKEMKDLERRRVERLKDQQLLEKKEKERIQLEESERMKRLEEEKEHQRILEEEAKKNNPDQQLIQMIYQFSLISQNTSLSIIKLRQERNLLLEKMSAAEKQEHLAAQQVAQAEKQQINAVEQEDFELADRLAEVIQQYEGEKNELSQTRKKIEESIGILDEERIDKCHTLLSGFEKIQKQLKDFSDEQENSDITDSTELMKKFEQDTKRLAAENERLSADLKTIERDEELVKEERTELENTISEQTVDIEGRRDEASAKLTKINGEIEELRKLLAGKEMEAAEVKMELHCHEEAIEQIRGTFSRQLTRLSKKEAAIDESRRDWAAEKELYKISRVEHETEVTAHSAALVAHDKLITHIKEEILVAEKLAKVIGIEVVMAASLSNDDENDTIAKAQAEVLRCEAATEEANQVLMAAKVAIDKLVEEISAIEVQLPILEAEKKKAASERDFKAAGKASKEIKELNARRERCKEELSGDAVERQTIAQGEVDNCVQVLEEKKSLLYQKEKEGGRQRMVQLVKKIVKLEKIREDICGTGDDEMEGESLKSVGGFVLDSEIATLVAEGEDLGKKFGGWSELLMEYAEGDNDESTEKAIPNEEKDGIANGDDTCEERITQDKVISEDEIEKVVTAVVDDVQNDSEDKYDGTNNHEHIHEESKVDALERCKIILSEINQFEAEIEVAIDEEDYDAAAALDDKIQKLREEMTGLGLSESDIESLKVMATQSSNDSKGSQSTDKSYDIISNKIEEEESIDNQNEHDDINGMEEQNEQEKNSERINDDGLTLE